MIQISRELGKDPKTVRKRYGLTRIKESFRQYQQVEQLPYGKQTQVDFGQFIMRAIDGKRKKVYFITMVMSRSRYKYIRFTLIRSPRALL